MRAKDTLKRHKSTLRALLIERGYDVSGATFEALIEDIARTHMFLINKENYVVSVENGYIKDVTKVDVNLHVAGNIPSDIHLGYYKLVDGKIVLDEIRREELLSLD